jgi:hypothetical protein
MQKCAEDFFVNLDVGAFHGATEEKQINSTIFKLG